MNIGDRTVENERLTVPVADPPERRSRAGRLCDPLALAVALALIGISAYVGHGLKERGLSIVLPRPPLLRREPPAER